MCDDRITPLLNTVLECVQARFDDCDAPGFCRSGIVAGTVAWDDCCDCGDDHGGQLWVRVADWSPDPDFPANGPGGCAQPGLINIGVGALRCVPTVDETGRAPSARDEAEAATRIYSDAQLILSGVMCCVEASWVGWVPLGYDGGCGGGEHLFSLSLSPCRCN